MASERPTGAPRWWFIYYRVRADDLGTAVAAARAAQQALCAAQAGLEATLMQRPASSDGEITLLEAYSAAAGSTEDALRDLPAAIEATVAPALRPWLAGPRHLEAFTPCA